MEKQTIVIKKAESLIQLQNQIGIKLLISDDVQNTFYSVYIGGKINCGIAYYNYGIEPSILLSEENSILSLGFGEKIVRINIQSNEVIWEEKTPSVFYEFLIHPTKSYLCAICELDIYCFDSTKIIWKIGFRDIINEYKFIDDKAINITCNDGETFTFLLESGVVLG